MGFQLNYIQILDSHGLLRSLRDTRLTARIILPLVHTGSTSQSEKSKGWGLLFALLKDEVQPLKG